MTTTLGTVSGVPGLLSDEEIAAQRRPPRVAAAARAGQIPWFDGGHCDPWNHVEAAMALTVTGYLEEARAAYRWLARRQLGDGSWFNYYVGDRREGRATRHQRVRLHRGRALPLRARDR